jgi:hypothetical protein
MDHLGRAYLREAHSGNLLTPEDYQICQREAGEAGKAAKELDEIALHIGKPTLDDQTTQLCLGRHSQGRGDRAERIAHDAKPAHIYIAPPAQILDDSGYIFPLARSIRDEAVIAVSMPGEIEEQRSIPTTPVQSSYLFYPLAPVVMNSMAAN